MSVHILVNVMITTSGSPSVGEMYTLECSVTGSNDQPTITWLEDGAEITSSATRMVSTTTMNSSDGYSSTLTFTPLSAFDAGMFMCRATLGDVMQIASIALNVEGKSNVQIHENVYSVYSFLSSFVVPTVSVSVDAGVATPTVGAMYSLTCTVTGAERLTGSTITYQWFKDGVVVSGQTMETLSFTSLTFSDAGGYTCEATVMSSLLSGPITTARSSAVDITLTCESLM